MKWVEVRSWEWLFAALAIGVLALLLGQRRSLVEMSSAQRRVSFAVRATLLLLLALALAGVHAILPSRQLAVLFAVDLSGSMPASARDEAHRLVADSTRTRPGNTSAGIIAFSRRAEVIQPLAKEVRFPEQWPQLAEKNGTDLEHTLEFAAAVLPGEGARRVVLVSDGNDTGGHALEAAQRLKSMGIEVWTAPVGGSTGPEVLVENVDIPRRVKLGEPFDLSARIRSTVTTHAKVKLYQNQFLVDTKELELKPGTNEFRAANLQPEGTFATFEVEVLPDADTSPENNKGSATTTLSGQPRILVIDSDERQVRPLAEAMRAEKLLVETRGLNGLPTTLEDLQQFDLFLFSDIPALQVTREQMELYRRWVQDFGGGFIMLGGENSYGVGGYFHTPVEQMLPVQMEHEDRQETPSVALLVVLDRSGSMTAQVQGQTKMSLANQGAVFAMNALQSKDFFGVLAVDTRSHTVTPLAQITARDAAEQKISSVTAGGGGIYVYTSLAEAFQQLRDVQARIKHVILFSDAADAEEKTAGEMSDGARGAGSSLDLASAMLTAKITTSVVALGSEQDKDTPFLRQLAERGNGRFYLTSDATTLPQIFSTETMKVAQSSLIEEPFVPVVRTPTTTIAGIDWPQAPLLLGYNTTKPKPSSEILLATERGDPLLATWRYGLGLSGAFTSDAKSRWASEWLQWPGYGKFWAQLARSLMRKSDQAAFNVTTRETGDRLTLTLEALNPDGKFRNQLPVQIAARAPDGTTAIQPAAQEAPGTYRADFDLAAEGTTLFSVSSTALPDGGTSFGYTRSYPREYLSVSRNDQLLQQIAAVGKGRFAPAASDIFVPPVEATFVTRDLTDWFLIAALILLPIDIWVRRKAWH